MYIILWNECFLAEIHILKYLYFLKIFHIIIYVRGFHYLCFKRTKLNRMETDINRQTVVLAEQYNKWLCEQLEE